MFLREMKVNFKSFITFTLVLIGLNLLVFLLYPSILSSDNVQMLNEMMKVFPPEVLKAFNMDISGIDSAFGWFKTEGLVFILLITGLFSAILGSSILLKEENDKTIKYLNSLPITRKEIVLNKVASSLIYIVLMILLLMIFNFIGLSLSGSLDFKLYFLLSITPILSSLVIFFSCLYFSTFAHKTRKTLVFSLGFVFISYFWQIISQLGDKVEFFKYLSVFTLADIRNVIVSKNINIILVIISFVLSTIFLVLTLKNYQKKDLV